MRLRIISTVLLTASVATYGQPQRRTFEVASVRLNPNCNADGPSRGASSPESLTLECADLRDLIVTAYGVYANDATPVPGRFRMQVSGGPRWMDAQHFEILATAAPRSTQAEILGPMLRALLEDRFSLKVHRETKDSAIYRLTVAKAGPKLQPAKDGSCATAGRDETNVLPTCGSISIQSSGEADFQDVTMTDLCTRLSMVLDREVIDATGLTGKYNFQLQTAPGDLNPRFVAGRDQAAGDVSLVARVSSLFSALPEQLGLRLEAARGPVESIVVDQIEHPSEN